MILKFTVLLLVLSNAESVYRPPPIPKEESVLYLFEEIKLNMKLMFSKSRDDLKYITKMLISEIRQDLLDRVDNTLQVISIEHGKLQAQIVRKIQEISMRGKSDCKIDSTVHKLEENNKEVKNLISEMALVTSTETQEIMKKAILENMAHNLKEFKEIKTLISESTAPKQEWKEITGGMQSQMCSSLKEHNNILEELAKLIKSLVESANSPKHPPTSTKKLKKTENQKKIEEKPKVLGTSCSHLKELGYNNTNIYYVKPEFSPSPFQVLCEMTVLEGGWTYILNRFEDSTDFDQDWQSYKNGFGDLTGNFWLGLEKLYYLMTHGITQLMIELTNSEGTHGYALYDDFKIGNEDENYALQELGSYDGNAGDSLLRQLGMEFSTKDSKASGIMENVHCAKTQGGGWWYKNCSKSHLTGKNITWESFQKEDKLIKARMLIKTKKSNVEKTSQKTK